MCIRPKVACGMLIHRLIERLTQLSMAYGGTVLPCVPDGREARNALLHLADNVRRIDDRTRWTELRGYSNRTTAPTNISGIMARSTLGVRRTLNRSCVSCVEVRLPTWGITRSRAMACSACK